MLGFFVVHVSMKVVSIAVKHDGVGGFCSVFFVYIHIKCVKSIKLLLLSVRTILKKKEPIIPYMDKLHVFGILASVVVLV